jgi:RHS repeat-associated protein
VIGLADGTGTIKTSYNYSPFGKKQTTGASSDNPFTFTGREDDGTGLYYYRARYYSPDQKRFIAADPLGFGGGDSNFYAYVGNNPINFSDPTGESWESFAQGLAVGGASGLVSSFLITAALTATGVTIGPLIGAVLLLGGGAALIESINEIANEPCPDKRDYLLGALIGGFAGGYSGARLGGGLGAGLRARGGGGGAPCSFVEGTPVQTKDGPKPIEKVKPEDSVLARNEKTGEQSYHKVSQTFATPHDEIYDLELTQQDGKSDILGVTGNHPFWLKGKGWTESDLLKAGDLVAGKDGAWLKVIKLTLREGKQTAYNLEVEQDHTYFVGLAGAWVHNSCPTNLKDILSNAKRVGDRLESTLEDGTKVIFRQDIGNKAHPIGTKYPNPVDHYNIEVHAPIPGRPGRYNQVGDAHIIVDTTGKATDIIYKGTK